jgi:hypothetical protein
MFDKLLPNLIEDRECVEEEEDNDNDHFADKEKEKANTAQLRSERESILAQLYGTKLYWFLLRCLEDYGPGRKLFYI